MHDSQVVISRLRYPGGAVALHSGRKLRFFARNRPRTELDTSPTTVAPAGLTLRVVEFWTAGQRYTAGVDLSQGRLADLTNRDRALDVVPLPYRPEDRSQPIEVRRGQHWSTFAIDDALLIFPPPQATDPVRRLHRPRQPVEIVIGPFVVSGMAHIPPGAQAAGFLFRQKARFVALTRAVVRDSGVPGFEQSADVVLVNLRRVQSIRDVGVDESPAWRAVEVVAPST